MWKELGRWKPRCTMTPSPRPVRPWQGEQKTRNSPRPRSSSSAVTGTGISVTKSSSSIPV